MDQDVFDFGAPKALTYADLPLKELFFLQIKRDTAVLLEDPIYYAPDRQFYVDRIASYRHAYNALTTGDDDV